MDKRNRIAEYIISAIRRTVGRGRVGTAGAMGVVVATIASLLLIPTSSGAVTGFSANGTLNVRSSPSTAASIINHVPSGAAIDINCQTTGTNVNGSSIWDKLNGYGGYVSDYYVNGTPYAQFDTAIPPCGVSLGSPIGTIFSPNGLHRFDMQGDGNLVAYRAYGAGWQYTWASWTQNPGAQAFMQSDGNLVIYRAGQAGIPNGALWQSGTSGHPGAHLAVQDDGNVVIYASTGQPLWNTGTSSPFPYWYTATAVCNHVFRIDSPTVAWDPKSQFLVSRSYTFGYGAGHCVYKITDQVGVDVNTLALITLQNYYDIGWHWDVLSAAGAGAAACNPQGLYWAPELLPYRAVMTAWCGAVAAAGYVIS